MTLFIIIVIAEIAFCLFRSLIKNAIRLGCNVLAALIAGIIAGCVNSSNMSLIKKFDIDFTFGGMLDSAFANKLSGIADDFAVGIGAVALMTLIYLVLKLISQIVVFFVFRNKEKPALNPLGAVFGIVIGIICAGITLAPLTGVQQVFPDEEAKTEVLDEIIVKNTDAKTAKYARTLLNSPAQNLTKFTGVGLITNKLFNSWTTAATDSGSENLKTFINPFFGKLDRLSVVTSQNASIPEKASAAADLLEVLAVTKLFTDAEKIGVIEKIVRENVTQLDELPKYSDTIELAHDVRSAGRLIEILNRSGIDVTAKIEPEKINISDSDINAAVEELYSMNQAEFFVSYIIATMFKIDRSTVLKNVEVKQTKNAMIKLLTASMELKRMHDEKSITLQGVLNIYNNLKGNELVNDDVLKDFIMQFQ